MLGRRFLVATFIISAGSLIAEQQHLTTGVSVPFVGCPSDGQVGPIEAPSGKDLVVSIGAELAQRLGFLFGKIGARSFLRLFRQHNFYIDYTGRIK